MTKRKKNTINSKGVSYSNLAQTKAHRFVQVSAEMDISSSCVR